LKFAITIAFDLGIPWLKNTGDLGMSDWAKQAVTQAKQREQQQLEESKASQFRAEQIANLGPDLWLKVAESFKEKSVELNNELRDKPFIFEFTAPNEFTVTKRGSDAYLEGKYERKMHRIELRGVRLAWTGRTLYVKFNAVTDKVCLEEIGHESAITEKLAMSGLEALLNAAS
jgi:hypothetical protein